MQLVSLLLRRSCDPTCCSCCQGLLMDEEGGEGGKRADHTASRGVNRGGDALTAKQKGVQCAHMFVVGIGHRSMRAWVMGAASPFFCTVAWSEYKLHGIAMATEAHPSSRTRLFFQPGLTPRWSTTTTTTTMTALTPFFFFVHDQRLFLGCCWALWCPHLSLPHSSLSVLSPSFSSFPTTPPPPHPCTCIPPCIRLSVTSTHLAPLPLS